MTPPERTFDEPWQAHAFALTVRLHEAGAFTWTEWAAALSREVAALGPDDGGRYYEAWLSALEFLTTQKNLAAAGELSQMKEAWSQTYQRTPHGHPVTLVSSHEEA